MKKYSRTSKYGKYKMLLVDEQLKSSMPETKRFTKQNFMQFIDKYGTFIVKPSIGSHGYGVNKITFNEEHYVLQSGSKKKNFHNADKLLHYLRKTIKTRRYIVQEYIPLASIEGRTFDIRVIVQQKENSDWVVTGLYSKVARKGQIITNLRTKSSIKMVDSAIKLSNINTENNQVEEILQQINEISIKTANVLSRTFHKQRIWGLDLGLDKEGKVWIIEANSRPGTRGFRRLKDKSMYRTIREFKRKNKLIITNK